MLNITEVADAWHQRFTFYDTYGLPSSSPKARQAFKQLPFWTRTRMGWNTLAFLFGPLYFIAKGMWRKGLVLLTAAFGLAAIVVLLDAPEMIDRVASLVVPALAGTAANYAYYLHVVMESRSWNPLEGFGRKKTSK